MPDVLVVNASPLVFLGNAGRLDLLQAPGASRVVVPEAVFQEVVGSRHQDRAQAALVGAGWIERIGPTPIPARVIEWDLDPGEAEVIALALATPGATAVLDDLMGRKCALALGVGITGTLGIVMAAARSGYVKDPREVILGLRASGMWLSDATISRAFRLAGLAE